MTKKSQITKKLQILNYIVYKLARWSIVGAPENYHTWGQSANQMDVGAHRKRKDNVHKAAADD